MSDPATTPTAGGEEPSVESFAINPMGEPDIIVDGHRRFVGESDFVAYRAWAKRAIAALSAPPPAAGATGVVPEGADEPHPAVKWPLRARVWTRTSVTPHEKVLEIEGSINDTGFICRHTQPIWVADEDIPGLPERYRCECTATAPEAPTPVTSAPKDECDPIGDKARQLCAEVCSWAEGTPCSECAAEKEHDWRRDAEQSFAPVTSAPVAEGVNQSDSRKEVMLNDPQGFTGGDSPHVTSPGSECDASRGAPGAEGGDDLAALSVRTKVDSQVWLAAQQTSDEQRKQPEWLWFCYDGADGTPAPEYSFGRWPRVVGQVPYVRADIALSIQGSETNLAAPMTEGESEAPIYEAFARYVGNVDERASDFRMFATGYHAALSAPTPAPVAQGEPVAWVQFRKKLVAERDSWMNGSLATDRARCLSDVIHMLDVHVFGAALSETHPRYPLYAAPAAPRSADLPGREEIAKRLWDERYGHLPDASYSAAVEIAEDIPDGNAAKQVARVRETADAILKLLTPTSPTQEMRAAGGEDRGGE